MYKAYVCKFCHAEISASYVQEHTFKKHFDRLYEPSYDQEAKEIGEQKSL